MEMLFIQKCLGKMWTSRDEKKKFFFFIFVKILEQDLLELCTFPTFH